MAAEPPPILYWMRVVNSDAEDYERVGMLIDMFGEDEGLKRWFVVDFGKGDIGAFMPEEVERFYAT